MQFSREDLEQRAQLPRWGGALCIDFVNTVSSWVVPEPVQYLADYADLVAWNWHADQLAEPAALALLAAAGDQPLAAARIFRAGLTLRDALYRIFSASSRATLPAPDDLRVLHTAYQTALPFTELRVTAGRIGWALTPTIVLEQALWPVCHSALELLTSPQLARVKACANDQTCGWLFLDHSKNGSRRWCAMSGCGTRDKMRRYNQRRRENSNEVG